MDGLYWKTLLKWMICGYHYFRKHPYVLNKDFKTSQHFLPNKPSTSTPSWFHPPRATSSRPWESTCSTEAFSSNKPKSIAIFPIAAASCTGARPHEPATSMSCVLPWDIRRWTTERWPRCTASRNGVRPWGPGSALKRAKENREVGKNVGHKSQTI